MTRFTSPRLIAGCLALAIVLAGCSQDKRPPSAGAGSITVQTATAQRGALSSGLWFSGSVQAKQQLGIVPKSAGRVTRLAVDVGGVVAAGDILVELEKDALSVQVAQAQAGLDAAQAKLNALEAGPRDEQVAQAQAGLDAARAKLAALEAGPRDEQVAQAQAALDAAQAKLRALEAGPRSEQVAQAEAGLRSAQARMDQLKAGPTAEQRRASLEAVEGAKVQVHSANVRKDGDCSNFPGSYICKSDEAAAFAAQHSVDAAQAQYDALVAPPTPEKLAEALAAVDSAKQQLNLAKQPATESDLQAARSAVTQAQAALDLAKRPVTKFDFEGARAAVAQAQAAVDLAKKPATKFDLDGARAAVAQAKAAVDLAKLQLAEATVRAPFPGVVAQRMVSVGSLVGSGSPMLTLISKDAEVAVSVDEQTLASIKTGLPATITLNAYPGKELAATISSVAPVVDAKTRTTEVRLSPRDAEGLLREGMSARAQLASGAAAAVLVPQTALVQESAGPVVYVVANGRATRQAVKTGASSGDQTEILEGLAEGQQIAVSGLSTLRDGAAVTVQ